MEVLKKTKTKLVNKAKRIIGKELIAAKPLTDKDKIAFRLLKCRGDENDPACPFYVKDKDGIEIDECGKCGCIIETKAETLNERHISGELRRTHCPMGYWLDKQTANYYREKDGKELLK